MSDPATPNPAALAADSQVLIAWLREDGAIGPATRRAIAQHIEMLDRRAREADELREAAERESKSMREANAGWRQVFRTLYNTEDPIGDRDRLTRDLAAAQSALAAADSAAAAIREEMRAQGAREVEAAMAHVRALVDAYSSQGTRHARDAAWSQAHAWLQRQQQPAADAKEGA